MEKVVWKHATYVRKVPYDFCRMSLRKNRERENNFQAASRKRRRLFSLVLHLRQRRGREGFPSAPWRRGVGAEARP